MLNPPPFTLFEDLLGCRTDDPRLVELHRANDLWSPPEFTDRREQGAYGVDEFGWALTYQATARVPGLYPSIRVRGRGHLLGYLTKVWIKKKYPSPIRDGLTTALPEPEARERALDSSVAEYRNVVHVLYRDERSTLEARYHDDGRFVWYLLTLNERAEDDPELLRAAEQVRAVAPVRPIPALPEPDVEEPFPAALAALYDYQRTSGFGRINFEMHDRFEFGGPTAWTGDAGAEREFRVFGMDACGGPVAFWLVHHGRPIVEQPVVFLESEGAVGPVATDLCDLMYLLAAGFGPFEAIMSGMDDEDADPQGAIAHIAEAHFGRRVGRTAEAILADANAEYSDIMDRLDALGS